MQISIGGRANHGGGVSAAVEGGLPDGDADLAIAGAALLDAEDLVDALDVAAVNADGLVVRAQAEQHAAERGAAWLRAVEVVARRRRGSIWRRAVSGSAGASSMGELEGDASVARGATSNCALRARPIHNPRGDNPIIAPAITRSAKKKMEIDDGTKIDPNTSDMSNLTQSENL
eukprot:SAG11_NODE_3571_length_2362_cov_3.051701_3_plen_174_part_00